MSTRVPSDRLPPQGETYGDDLNSVPSTMSVMPRSFGERLHSKVGQVARGLCLLSGVILLLAMGAATCVDVVMRQLGAGIPGIWEAVTLAMRWVIGLALPYAFFSGSHIAVELFTDWLPPRWRQLAIVLTTAVSLVVVTLLAWKVVGRTLDTRSYGGITSDLGLPTYFDWIPLAVGPVLSVPVLISMLWREAAIFASGRHPVSSLEQTS